MKIHHFIDTSLRVFKGIFLLTCDTNNMASLHVKDKCADVYNDMQEEHIPIIFRYNKYHCNVFYVQLSIVFKHVGGSTTNPSCLS